MKKLNLMKKEMRWEINKKTDKKWEDSEVHNKFLNKTNSAVVLVNRKKTLMERKKKKNEQYRVRTTLWIM